MGKLKIEDLKKIKEQVKVTTAMRADIDKDVKVIVHMGTCGIASGARSAMTALMTAAEEKSLDIEIGQSGCIGICDREPIVTVIRKGEPQVRYGKVTAEIMREIVEAHVVGGAVLEKYMLADAPKA
jgi:NADP-reducing hydrogenase subunit HndB